MRTTRRSFLAALPLISLGASRATSASSGSKTRGAFGFQTARHGILEAVAAGKATGVAVAVAHNGRIVWEEGFGWANREARLKATPHTPFCLASVTKPFTTTALATLAAEGRLKLDEPANAYLGEHALRGSEAGAATVRQLGAHAAGLPSLFVMYRTRESARSAPVEEVLREYGTLAYPPDKLYEYSNIGYAALGAIATRLTGLEIGSVITRRVLEPLGMHNSFFDTEQARLSRAAARYDELDKPIPYYTTATPASGELYASAHDLARFAMFNLKNFATERHPVLSEEWIDDLHAPVLHGPAAGATTFGWFSGSTEVGLPVLYKDGGQPGVSTIMYLVPSANLACLVLANRTDNGDLTQSVVDHMAAAVLPAWTTPDTSMNAPRSPFSATPDYLGRWTGSLGGGEADRKLQLEISIGSGASLSLSPGATPKSFNLQMEGPAVIGRTMGTLDDPDPLRNSATALSLKLLPYNGNLTGRLLAVASNPGKLATIPFTLTLRRSQI
jgi:CubicO group peptidase (beta-lactamase class C family)